MKNRNNVFTATLVVLAFAFAPVLEAGQHLEGGPDPIGTSASFNSPPDSSRLSLSTAPTMSPGERPVHSSWCARLGKRLRRDMRPALIGGTYVNFKVSGTAIAGVDYVLLVSPAYIGRSGYGLIQVKTLRDPRGSAFRQALSVIVTLEPGAGYAVGAARSATMWIKPALQSSNQSSN